MSISVQSGLATARCTHCGEQFTRPAHHYPEVQWLLLFQNELTEAKWALEGEASSWDRKLSLRAYCPKHVPKPQPTGLFSPTWRGPWVKPKPMYEAAGIDLPRPAGPPPGTSALPEHAGPVIMQYYAGGLLCGILGAVSVFNALMAFKEGNANLGVVSLFFGGLLLWASWSWVGGWLRDALEKAGVTFPPEPTYNYYAQYPAPPSKEQNSDHDTRQRHYPNHYPVRSSRVSYPARPHLQSERLDREAVSRPAECGPGSPPAGVVCPGSGGGGEDPGGGVLYGAHPGGREAVPGSTPEASPGEATPKAQESLGGDFLLPGPGGPR